MIAPSKQVLQRLIPLLQEFGGLPRVFPDLVAEENQDSIYLALYQSRKYAEELLAALSCASEILEKNYAGFSEGHDSGRLTDDQLSTLADIDGKMLTLAEFLDWYNRGEYNKIVSLDRPVTPERDANEDEKEDAPLVAASAAATDAVTESWFTGITKKVANLFSTPSKKPDEQTLLEQLIKILNNRMLRVVPAQPASDSAPILYKRSTAKKGALMERAQILDTVLKTVRRISNAAVDVLTIHVETLRSLNTNDSLDVFLVSLKYAAWIFALIRFSIYAIDAMFYTFAKNTRSPLEEKIPALSLLSDQLLKRNWVRNFRDLTWQGRIVECVSDNRLLSSQITAGLYAGALMSNMTEAWRKSTFCDVYIEKNRETENQATAAIIHGIQNLSWKSFINFALSAFCWFVCVVGAVLNVVGNNRSNEREKMIDTVGSCLIVFATFLSIIWDNKKYNTTALLPKTKQYHVYLGSAVTTPQLSPQTSGLFLRPSPPLSPKHAADTSIISTSLLADSKQKTGNESLPGTPPPTPTSCAATSVPVSPDPKGQGQGQGLSQVGSQNTSRTPSPPPESVDSQPDFFVVTLPPAGCR